MRKYIILVVLVCMFCFLHCGKKYTRLIITIGEQPEGGNNVTEMLCIILGQLVDGDTPIQAAVRWRWKEAVDDTAITYWRDTWTFHYNQPTELWAPLTAPEGYVFSGYFWFEIDWEDEDGTPNLVVTDTAFCYSL